MAPQLRKLQISSTIIYPEPNGIVASIQPISFPCLRLLEIRDMYLDALEVVLSAVAPGAYETTMYNTCKCFYKVSPEEMEWQGPNALTRVIRGTGIHTLMFACDKTERHQLKSDALNQLLAAVPSVECLLIHNWTFPELYWTALSGTETLGSFPKLRRVEITGSKLFFPEDMKALVENHPIEEMVLGGDIHISQDSHLPQDDSNTWKPIAQAHVLVEWLKAKVPKFEVVDSDHEPSHFDLNGWALS
ncbi:hypothetical protein RSOLAG1IB_09105 [Rhizoctonia solani AG-1 IB]|uniref:Uncharacterized protein n=1 Tax=Thanatephorus cucumeris (strain AG1-IB / isolate 7/3/14) TaxID=1108050 RepID=A0A0B7FSG0_THACB|nr:hypothetical protein RSOLAG1IB_09105 [Rhizoctonia solani AG-1 IB]